MAKIREVILISFVWIVGAATPAWGEAQDHQVLAEQLLGVDLTERVLALQRMKAILAGLHEALIIAMEREGQYEADRQAAFMRGEKLDAHRDTWFPARLTEVVIGLRDPRTIPSLVAVLGTGSSATPFALAAFGELAAAELVEVAKSTDNIFQMDDALVALRCMVENVDTHPLSSETLNGIVDVADYRFNNPTRLAENGVQLSHAIDLAIALNDRNLLQTVNLMASDSQALLERGVTMANIDRVQKIARARMSGAEARRICRRL